VQPNWPDVPASSKAIASPSSGKGKKVSVFCYTTLEFFARGSQFEISNMMMLLCAQDSVFYCYLFHITMILCIAINDRTKTK
jgi:hypothetical protein